MRGEENEGDAGRSVIATNHFGTSMLGLNFKVNKILCLNWYKLIGFRVI